MTKKLQEKLNYLLIQGKTNFVKEHLSSVERNCILELCKLDIQIIQVFQPGLQLTWIYFVRRDLSDQTLEKFKSLPHFGEPELIYVSDLKTRLMPGVV